MTPQDAENLLFRYAAQQCTEQEEELVNAWFNKVVKETDYAEPFSMNVHAMSDDWERLIAERGKQMPVHRHKTRIIGRSVAAAVAAAAIAVGVLLYYKPPTKVNNAAIAATMDTTISHRDNDFKLTLPDNTVVYLNGASSLRYARSFAGKQREVFLEGEAYFEVSPDKKRPFIVHSRGQKVQVLGTHFNISSYDGEPVSTTLLEGAVKITTTGSHSQEVLLKPGFQATLGPKGFEVKEVDPGSATSWKEAFVFNQTPLKNVLKQLGRWYKVDIDSSRVTAVTLDAVYGKYETLPNLLKEITQSTGVKLVLNNNVITVE
ncbi:FecR domain-containing protein [Chitinophaga sp.]|uniref:FecR family protein n=1 Tax=Chitinophaga sp. TaxID=1869181 RepID=UPI0031D6F5B1